MEFFDYNTVHEAWEKLTHSKVDMEKFYHSPYQILGNDIEAGTINQWHCEYVWLKDKKPYYNIYPGIIRHLIKLKEEKVPTSAISLPIAPIVFRMPKNNDDFKVVWQNQSYQLRTILAHEAKIEVDMTTANVHHKRSMMVWMDFGERNINIPIHFYKKIPLSEETMLEEAIDKLPDSPTSQIGMQVPEEMLRNAIRLVLSTCLISQDLEDGLIVPDVLSDDRIKYEQSKFDPKYVDKAKRRGKFGFNVGASIEIAPHWRGPSPLALYWTGEGRKTPKYRYRKGSIVHREIVKEIPSGYKENE